MNIIDTVRAYVEPLNTALGYDDPTIYLVGSFGGLPLINQALVAAGRPLTVRSWIKILETIPIDDILRALAAQRANDHPPGPPLPGPPPPGRQPPGWQPPGPPLSKPVTCSAEWVSINGANVGIRIFGGGFLGWETVEILEGNLQVTMTSANEFGGYTVNTSFLSSLLPVHHTVYAHGLISGRTSNNAGFNV
jgi:hypothetical protein